MFKINLFKKVLPLFIITFLLLSFVTPVFAEIDTGLDTTAQTAGYETTNAPTPQNIVADIINVILGFLGLIFVVLIIMSGFQWMTAGGNSDMVAKAKQRLLNAIIGLVIVLAAYSITSFILYAVDLGA